MTLYSRLTESTGKLTLDQMAMLKELVLNTLRQHQAEKERWGDEAAAKAAKHGLLIAEVELKEKLGWQLRKILRVASELEKLGFITIRQHKGARSVAVHGPYRKKLLYWKKKPTTDTKFVVTKAGIQAYKEQV